MFMFMCYNNISGRKSLWLQEFHQRLTVKQKHISVFSCNLKCCDCITVNTHITWGLFVCCVTGRLIEDQVVLSAFGEETDTRAGID